MRHESSHHLSPSMSSSSSDASGSASNTASSKMMWHVEQAQTPSQAPSSSISYFLATDNRLDPTLALVAVILPSRFLQLIHTDSALSLWSWSWSWECILICCHRDPSKFVALLAMELQLRRLARRLILRGLIWDSRILLCVYWDWCQLNFCSVIVMCFWLLLSCGQPADRIGGVWYQIWCESIWITKLASYLTGILFTRLSGIQRYLTNIERCLPDVCISDSYRWMVLSLEILEGFISNREMTSLLFSNAFLFWSKLRRLQHALWFYTLQRTLQKRLRQSEIKMSHEWSCKSMARWRQRPSHSMSRRRHVTFQNGCSRP